MTKWLELAPLIAFVIGVVFTIVVGLIILYKE